MGPIGGKKPRSYGILYAARGGMPRGYVAYPVVTWHATWHVGMSCGYSYVAYRVAMWHAE